MIGKHLPHAAFVLALLLPVISLGQEPRTRSGGATILKPSFDFAKRLNRPAKWQLGNLGTLTLKMDGDSTVFFRNETEEVFRLNPPEYVDEATQSEDGKTLVLTVMKSRGSGSDFATLVRIRPSEGKLEIQRVLESGMKLFEGNRWWLSDFGAVSNDGSRVLARFGVDDPNNGRIAYRWHTVELSSGKVLGEGLTIENGTIEKK